jgi:hypothetical protein
MLKSEVPHVCNRFFKAVCGHSNSCAALTRPKKYSRSSHANLLTSVFRNLTEFLSSNKTIRTKNISCSLYEYRRDRVPQQHGIFQRIRSQRLSLFLFTWKSVSGTDLSQSSDRCQRRERKRFARRQRRWIEISPDVLQRGSPSRTRLVVDCIAFDKSYVEWNSVRLRLHLRQTQY